MKNIRRFAIAFIFSGCSHLFYQPSHVFYADPAKHFSLPYSKISYRTSDGVTLQGWLLLPKGTSQKNPPKGLVVQFHGNAENRSSHFYSLAWVLDYHYALFAWDYRGYADSDGEPSQKGIYLDGLATFTQAAQMKAEIDKTYHAHTPIIYFGQSLGGAILARCYADLNERADVKAVVLESTFTSYTGIASDVLSRLWLTWPFQWLGDILISNACSPKKSFAKISPTPLLIVHGTQDQTIPISFSEKIFALAKEPKTFWKIPGGQHLGLWSLEKGRYQDEVINYLARLPSPSADNADRSD